MNLEATIKGLSTCTKKQLLFYPQNKMFYRPNRLYKKRKTVLLFTHLYYRFSIRFNMQTKANYHTILLPPALRRFLFIPVFLLWGITTFAQNNWELKQDKEGIKVYTKNLDNSSFRAIKTVCTIEATPAVLTAVLLDINSSAEWVYATKKAILLKQTSPDELFYYSEIDVPWPVNNRDFIVHLKASQDERTKAVTIVADNQPKYLPENKNIVRVPQSYSKWLIEPLSNNRVKIEYILQVDPGGSVPAWLINLFAAKGPFESFKNLRLQVKKPVYQQVKLAFIKS